MCPSAPPYLKSQGNNSNLLWGSERGQAGRRACETSAITARLAPSKAPPLDYTGQWESPAPAVRHGPPPGRDQQHGAEEQELVTVTQTYRCTGQWESPTPAVVVLSTRCRGPVGPLSWSSCPFIVFLSARCAVARITWFSWEGFLKKSCSAPLPSARTSRVYSGNIMSGLRGGSPAAVPARRFPQADTRLPPTPSGAPPGKLPAVRLPITSVRLATGVVSKADVSSREDAFSGYNNGHSVFRLT
uniref:Uncharacterized protein n=1 Tax=Branchiostoma floridae TaxID=7739 RepID=C3ZTZ8_BRAFL|eukprot:XP_002587873.1 hypothetical protein BRAFLDRAFT_87260 [Branchiostoma floridae]